MKYKTITTDYLLNLCVELGYKEAKNNSGLTLQLLFDYALTGQSIITGLTLKLNCSKDVITRFIKNTFPDRRPSVDRDIVKFLLLKKNLKRCPGCEEVLLISNFHKNKSNQDGLADQCKSCSSISRTDSYNLYSEKEIRKNQERKLSKIHRCPRWVNLEEIRVFYLNKPEGYHVDHIVPLHGKNVSGLHVINNLQYLTAEENLIKGNKFSP